MALAHFQRTFTDEFGNVQTGLSVEIRRESDGALAAIFSDEDGNTPKSNPFNTDSNGYGDFYVADGRYRIKADAGGIDWRNFDLLAGLGRTIYVGSVTELEALSPTTTGQEALVSGVPFKYSGTAWEPSAGFISPDCFDAIDDAAAIQAAVDYLDPAAGGEIRFDRNKTYTIGQRVVVVPTNNLTINFNRCGLVMDNISQTAFEITPQSLIDSGRKTGADFPASWIIGGTPYLYDGDFRTTMFENVSADRVKNLTIKNMVTDSNFNGTAFQVFSVDGFRVVDCDVSPINHSSFRIWHSTDIEYRNSSFGGSGTYLTFCYKCRDMVATNCEFDVTDSDRPMSFKGNYHGTGSIFLAAQPGHVDTNVTIQDSKFAATGTVVSRFLSFGIGPNSDQDVIGFAGGTPIGFLRREWEGAYFDNIRVQNNSYQSEKKVPYVIANAPASGVLVSGNKSYQSTVYVSGATDITVKDNKMSFDDSDITSNLAPITLINDIVVPEIKEVGNYKITNNSMLGHAGDPGEVVSQTHMYLRGKVIEISENTAINPGANVSFFADLNNASLTDYVFGENNTVLLDSGSVLTKELPVQTATGANANGGTVQCGVIDTVANDIYGVYKKQIFGANVTVEGGSTPGTATYGNRFAEYYILNGLVFFNLEVSWSGHTGTGALQIHGLPFPVNDRVSSNFKSVFNLITENMPFFSGKLVAFSDPGDDFIQISVDRDDNTLSAVAVDAAATVYISGFYPYRVTS